MMDFPAANTARFLFFGFPFLDDHNPRTCLPTRREHIRDPLINGMTQSSNIRSPLDSIGLRIGPPSMSRPHMPFRSSPYPYHIPHESRHRNSHPGLYVPQHFGARDRGRDAEFGELDNLQGFDWRLPNFVVDAFGAEELDEMDGEMGRHGGMRSVSSLEDEDEDCDRGGDGRSEMGGYAETIFEIEELDDDEDEECRGGGDLGERCEPVYEEEMEEELGGEEDQRYGEMSDSDDDSAASRHLNQNMSDDRTSRPPYHESASILAANGFVVPGAYPSKVDTDLAAREGEIEQREREVGRMEHALQVEQRQLQADRAQLEHL
jgi:hypothetical protein